MMITILSVVVLTSSMKAASTSIAGITYIDDYGVESRIRNLHDCDPFYWHPLHLPEYCAKMYERLIRSRLRGPVHIGRYKETQISRESDSFEDYETFSDYKRPKTKLDSMMESLNRDIQYKPSAPEIRMSNIGPIVVYQQAVSKISEAYIKGMAANKERPREVKLSSRKRRKEKRKKSKRSKFLSKYLRSGRSKRLGRKHSLRSRKLKEIGRLINP